MAVKTSTAIFVWSRDKYRCRGCTTMLVLESKNFATIGELHHVYRKSEYKKADRDDEWNLVLLCMECHKGKKGVHNGNKKLDRELKAEADIRKPKEERSTEKANIWRPYQTPAQKEKSREYAKKRRDSQIEKFKKDHDGMSPSKRAYQQRKKQLLLYKKSANG